MEDIPILNDLNPSNIPPKENKGVLILDYIRKYSPISFPQLMKISKLKRTNLYNTIRDLEFSRLITTFFKIDEMGRSVKWIKIKEGGSGS